MKAMRLHSFGAPNGFRLDEVPTPSPGATEVRIKVHTAGLNYTDLGQRAGRLPGVPPLPFVPGVECGGVVDEVGSEVRGISRGTRVVTLLPQLGACAEYAIAPFSSVVVLPDSVPFDRAVALPVQASTALLALRLGAQLQPGQTVFVPAAAGGVGTFLVQLAKRLGAGRVIGGASTETKRALAARLGADVVVDYTRSDWPDRVREATDGRGADVVFVMSGGEVGAQSLGALAPRGKLVLFGVDSMFDTELSKAQVAGLLAQNQSLVGFATFSLPDSERNAAVGEVLSLVERQELEVVVGQRFDLEDLGRAHSTMEDRLTSGKTVIVVEKRPVN
jgi:NADPH:quinone reductase